MASEEGSSPPAVTDSPPEKEQENVNQGKQETVKTAEQLEEEKLKAKYPNLKKAGPPAMIHKRLVQKGKYFDSGDYNMAKAAINNPKKPLPPEEKMLLQESIGEGIPTPENLPARKPSIVQSKLASGALS